MATATTRLLLRRGRALSTRSRPTRPRVLVVGGGPVGLTMGYLLDRIYGIPTRIVERQGQPTTHPQAHFLNLRTMEVLHATMPTFHDRLLEDAAPSDLWRDYIYTTGVGRQREFARIDQFTSAIPRPLATKDELLTALAPISPTQFLHFPQNRFETMLASFLDEHKLAIEREVELIGLETESGGRGPVRVRLRHKREGDRLEEAAFDYVIGADGAHSLVRRLCGIEMVGARNLQSIANVHFTSQALSRAARENPAMLYFVFNEHVIGVLIAHDLHKGEWVFQIPFFPPQESIAEDFTVPKCQELIRHLLPVAASRADDVEILSVGQWRMAARVAEQYDHERRVFLVGDAAHQFPPAGGFGMNTGIQDAHNLAWKLAWSIQTEDTTSSTLPVSSASLLRSYEQERQHTAKVNTQLSLRNVERTMKIPSALHVSHNSAKLLAAIINAPPVKYLPLPMQRDVIQGLMKIGKKPLGLLDAGAEAGAGSGLGARMRRQVQEIVARRASLGMLFYHFDFGFSYDTKNWAARARELLDDLALDRSARFALIDDAYVDPRVYRPQFQVGMRFPHIACTIEDLNHQAPHSVSTIALNDHLRRHPQDDRDPHAVRFLLLVDASQWPEGLALSTKGTWDHVQVVLVDTDGATAAKTIKSQFLPGVPSVTARVDMTHKTHMKWTEFADAYSAVLLRPDGHIGCLWKRGDLQSLGNPTAVAQAINEAVHVAGR